MLHEGLCLWWVLAISTYLLVVAVSFFCPWWVATPWLVTMAPCDSVLFKADPWESAGATLDLGGHSASSACERLVLPFGRGFTEELDMTGLLLRPALVLVCRECDEQCRDPWWFWRWAW